MISFLERYREAILGLCVGLISFIGLNIIDCGETNNKIQLHTALVKNMKTTQKQMLVAEDAFGTFEKLNLPLMPKPKLPTMNKETKKTVEMGDSIKVVGVINNTALVERGNKVHMVKAWQQSDIGNIGVITNKGLYIDGVFYALNANVITQKGE